jgi:hypothetical protein
VSNSNHPRRIQRVLALRCDPRLHELARRIHALGTRPLLELFAELEADGVPRTILERYARLHAVADFIKEHGGPFAAKVSFSEN